MKGCNILVLYLDIVCVFIYITIPKASGKDKSFIALDLKI